MEVQYSQIIAITMIIMLLGSTIPMLYVAGMLLCLCIYWGSKCLFLNYYRNPPKYGLELAQRVRSLIELSALVHVFFGCYMLTNDEILPYEVVESSYYGYGPNRTFADAEAE
jgi:hypothetical protein